LYSSSEISRGGVCVWTDMVPNLKDDECSNYFMISTRTQK
jgi:hypothetical protein